MHDPNLIQHTAYLNDLEAMVAKCRTPQKLTSNDTDYGAQLRAMAIILAIVVTVFLTPVSGFGA